MYDINPDGTKSMNFELFYLQSWDVQSISQMLSGCFTVHVAKYCRK